MDKSLFRAGVRLRLSALSDTYISESDSGILKNLLTLPEFLSAKRVFAYYSVDREADTRALITRALSLGLPLALPRTEPKRQMSFALISSLDELVTGPLGIPEPPGALPAIAPASGDVIIVPALCYDLRGYRLGHGGGYYDRFLSSCPAFTAGLCREALLCEAVPTQPHDIPVAALITENKIARPLRASQI